MNKFNSVEEVKNELIRILNKVVKDKKSGKGNINVVLLYAFNGTGKTRISELITEEEEDKCLFYNAYVEDYFTWNNREKEFLIDMNADLFRIIRTQELENDIIDNFKSLVETKLEPVFDIPDAKITFQLATGDSNSTQNVKISKGEESMFIWSVFYSILNLSLEMLDEELENRSCEDFNLLRYIIVDDPVSSIDDTKIIAIADQFTEYLNKLKSVDIKNDNKLSILITTHHPLFYNMLFNYFKNKSNDKFNTEYYVLMRGENNTLELNKQKSDSPFAYHLSLIEELVIVVNEDNIKKYHYNILRSLFEKTSNYLGYTNWADCISDEEDKSLIIKEVNQNSHNRLSDIEYCELSEEDKELFKRVFKRFLEDFNWKSKEKVKE